MKSGNVVENKNSADDAARLASIVESSNDAIYSVSLDGILLSWNPGAQRIYGFTPKEIIGQNLSMIVPADRLVEFPRILESIREGKAVANFLTSHQPKSGKEVLLSLTVSPLEEPQNRVVGAAVIARDINESERAEAVKERLLAEKSELLERLQLQMECMPIACVLADKDNHFTYWNPAAERTFGYFFNEVRGKKLEETLISPSDLSRAEASYERLQKGDKTIQGEVSAHRRKDGKTILCEWYVTPMRDSKGNLLGNMGMALDITERRKSEETLSQLASILEQTTDAVIGSDLDGKIFSWNHAAETMFGYHSEEILGENTALLVPTDRKMEMEKVRALATKEENVSNYETTLLKRNGEMVEVAVTVSPIKDALGKIVGVSSISRDITEKKNALETQKKHEEQMRLSQKLDALGRLAGGVAHDFNNLLSAIGGNSGFLKAALAPGDPHLLDVEEIEKAVKRGADLTRQLLAFGKKQISQPQLVDLNEMGSEMSLMFKRLIDASINFDLVQEKNLRSVKADPGQIQQVILNLVLNARDAMPKGGKLMLATKNIELAGALEIKGVTIPSGAYVSLSVTDTGTGMDDETQKHLFEPFFTTKGEKGTGLGLATVYGIVHQWGGYLWVYSAPGMGTTFTIYLPAAKEVAGAAALPKAESPSIGGSETVLVAEDEEQVRKVMVRALEHRGYRVLQARNGVEAVQQAETYGDVIHLLLTDTVMPKMNGKELADQLKKTRPKMVVLYMSGYPLDVLSEEGTIDLAIHLIQKPFSNDELAERVRKVLDAK